MEKDVAERTEKWKETTTDPTTLVIVTLSRLYRNIQSSLLLAERPALAFARNTVTNRDRAPLFLVNSSLPFYCVPPSSSVRLDNVQRDDKVSCLTLALLSRWALDGRAFLCVFIRAWRVTDDERTKLLLVRRRSLLFPWSLVTVKIILSLSYSLAHALPSAQTPRCIFCAECSCIRHGIACRVCARDIRTRCCAPVEICNV